MPGSINIPFQSAFSPEVDFVPCAAVATVKQNRGEVMVVAGFRGRNASNVSQSMSFCPFDVVSYILSVEVYRRSSAVSISNLSGPFFTRNSG
ncbi:hypothetical protein DPMN_172781 [Dreissena polymorpha]|uniref:Uncharacterized protein n=1 Tax=Dreissena polymorpha TaxID=45954 RepID=A0A9D4E0F0_DREPO|nr:hypothetical protein DPMN_172781 [Dreissena polymorpha]